MSHGIHRMLTSMAMQRPIPSVGDKFNISRLTWSNQNGRLWPLGSFRDITAIRRDDFKRMSMQVNGVRFLTDVPNTQTNSFPRFGNKRLGSRVDFAVKRKNIEIG